MKIIDINCAIGPWPDRRMHFNNIDGLISKMDKYNITNSVVYHYLARWNQKVGNALIHDTSCQYKSRIKACYILSPNLGTTQMPHGDMLLKQLEEEKPVAVKLYPNADLYEVDSFYCGELLDILNKLRMPLIFDADQTPSFSKLPALAKSYPGIKFIILRHGFRESRYIFPLIEKLDNVYFDTSIMIDTGIIEEIVKKYGSDKLLFGSGMPLFTPAGGLGLVIYSRISDEDKRKILHQNWEDIERSIERTVL